MVVNIIIQFGFALAQLIMGLALAIGSIYISLKLFDKFTKNLDEWTEIKNGNVAVGLLFGGIILSIAIIIEGGVSGIMVYVVPGMSLTAGIVGFAIGIVNLIIIMIAAVVSVYIAITVLDKITQDIDEIAELKKGNVAVAIMMVAVLLAVSFVTKGAVNGVIGIINMTEIIELFGL